MFTKVKNSLSKINYKLFLALLVLGLVPTIYTTVRVFFLGQLPGEYSFSIAGQLSWVNLLYEILSEAIVLPLFFFIGKVLTDKKEFANRMRTGLLVSIGAYTVLSVIIIAIAKPLLSLMATDKAIIDASATYIRIESVASIFSLAFNFIMVGMVTFGKEKYVYVLTAVKLVLCLLVDTFMVSTLPVSLNLGVNGIAFSNIIVNGILVATAIILLNKEGIVLFKKEKLSFGWMKDFLKVGGISGLESFVRNIAYMLMIVRMVNMVGEQGTYWVANNFIWGWLLLPVLQLGELIKRETATDENAVKNNTLGYFIITLAICVLWCITIPLWKPFMEHVLNFSDVDKLFELVMVLLGFYMLYAIQNVFDSTFYGLGKTNYMLFESVVTNTIYYGTAFILYLCGVWTPSLIGIALLFGIGNAFDAIVSLVAYVFLLKKKKINILDVDEN
ncbi:MAG: MATE family efflux transporter [Candidatus Borkfalkiaceae bacterium]|nr:MATE family efflux transporter [Christensenellaceae bacterium]